MTEQNQPANERQDPAEQYQVDTAVETEPQADGQTPLPAEEVAPDPAQASDPVVVAPDVPQEVTPVAPHENIDTQNDPDLNPDGSSDEQENVDGGDNA